MRGVALVFLMWQTAAGARAVDDAAHYAAAICPLAEEGEPAANAHSRTACLHAVMRRSEQRLAATPAHKARARHWAQANAFHQRWAQAQCALTSRKGGTPAAVDLARTHCLARLYSERAFFAQRLSAGDLQRVQRLIAAPESDCAQKVEGFKGFAARLPSPSGRTTGKPVREAAWVVSGADALARLQCKALGWRGRCRSELEHYYLSLVEIPDAPAPPLETAALMVDDVPAILP